MIQYFEWYLPADKEHWNRLKADAKHLSALGFSGIWIPPCCKATSDQDVGYGIYDLYDLGEFDQKGTVATKYGTREALLAAVAALHDAGLKVYADIVLNHKAGADRTEEISVVEVAPNNRDQPVSGEQRILAWTRFDFPGRAGKYSDFVWGWQHFTATDYDDRSTRKGVFKIIGENKTFAENVDQELGNYDYLMYADVDYHHPDVVEHTISWGKWLCDTLSLDGMRLYAVKHINQDFIEDFIEQMRDHVKRPFFAVAEYWRDDLSLLERYLKNENYCLTLFDVPLHYNLFQAAQTGFAYDLRTIFDGTLVQSNPMNVVTFVDNHDSQRHQSLESWVADWFKPAAYALILLRKDGYPCVFFGDYTGIDGPDPIPGKKDKLDPLLLARKNCAYGEQTDFFDDPHLIAWTRSGDKEHPDSGLVVLITNGEATGRVIEFQAELQGSTWYDCTGSHRTPVIIAEDGKAYFPVNGGSLSVWTRHAPISE